MQRTALIGMYSGIDVEGSGTEMGEELSKLISDLQSDQPMQGLDGDRPGFTTGQLGLSPILYLTQC